MPEPFELLEGEHQRHVYFVWKLPIEVTFLGVFNFGCISFQDIYQTPERAGELPTQEFRRFIHIFPCKKGFFESSVSILGTTPRWNHAYSSVLEVKSVTYGDTKAGENAYWISYFWCLKKGRVALFKSYLVIT